MFVFECTRCNVLSQILHNMLHKWKNFLLQSHFGTKGTEYAKYDKTVFLFSFVVAACGINFQNRKFKLILHMRARTG